MMTDDKMFEDEVRRIARSLWPSASSGGAIIEDNRERDGVFETEEIVHLIECTTSTRKDKAMQDAKKLALQISRRKSSSKLVKGYFVTLHEPTADQRSEVAKTKENIVAESFDTFRRRLIDARSYLSARENYPFGSVRNPDNDEFDDRSAYIEMDLIASDETTRSVPEVALGLLTGGRFVILGDYGAGKSTTMRELFTRIKGEFVTNQATRFPILLNLRDHHGQTNPAEALERHARNIGYSSPSHLVRAWRAGYAVILLDGFDEMAVTGWLGQANKLKQLRRNSMELVRRFIKDSAAGTGIAITGREHFFDSKRERQEAMTTQFAFIELSLNDFTEEQVKAYLKKKRWDHGIPNWLPSRPLLLGYLAAKGLLQQTIEVDSEITPAAGWNILLTLVCDREANIEVGLDGATIRELVERLATIARRGISGVGPLQPEDIVNTFRDVCGYAPDDRGLVLLQRLPGLGGHSADDGSREFIDRDFVDAARAGDVVSYIRSPFTTLPYSPPDWQCTLGPLGSEVAALQCSNTGIADKKVSVAAHNAAHKDAFDALCADIIQVGLQLRQSYDSEKIQIRGVLLTDVVFDDAGGDFSRVTFDSCLFQHLELGLEVTPERLPKFIQCYISKVDGRASERDLPEKTFDNCIFEEFEGASNTTASIMGTEDLSLGVRVMLSILKKLYLQAGNGRQESALLRGLDHKAKRLVPDVLQLLRQEGLALKSQAIESVVWLPVRSEGSRVRRMLAKPNLSSDQVLAAANNITS